MVRGEPEAHIRRSVRIGEATIVAEAGARFAWEAGIFKVGTVQFLL